MSLIYASAGGGDFSRLLQEVAAARAARRTAKDAAVRAAGDVATGAAAFQAEQDLQAREDALAAAVEEADTSVMASPATHVLIVGIGDYPHLQGGNLFPDRRAAFSAGLGQLTTSVAAAQSMADWFLTRFRNPRAPLATVELLLSPPEYRPDTFRPRGFALPAGDLTASATLGIPSQTGVPVSAATFQNIEEAFSRWYARCNAHLENVGIFYFAGHGIQREVQLLLAEDFGENPNQPLANSINFNGTYVNLGRCMAETQCYFIDACREIPTDLLRDFDVPEVPGRTLLGIGARGELRPRCAPIYQAAARARRAFGPANSPTHFSRLLQMCLEGVGVAANKSGRYWVVNTESLSQALLRSVEYEQSASRELSVDCGAGERNSVRNLHFVEAQRVPVLVKVEGDPSAALRYVEPYAQDIDGGQRIPRGERREEPWRLRLEAGRYLFGADSPVGAPYPSIAPDPNADQVLVLPPYYEWMLDWSQVPTVSPASDPGVGHTSPGGGGES
jgi:hypothetical protein